MILILMYYRHAFCLRLETHFVQLRRFLHQSQDICNNLPAPERVDQGGCAVLHWLAGFQRTLLLCGPSFRCKYALHLLRKWPVPFLNLSERWHALRFLKALGLYINIYNILFVGIFDIWYNDIYIYICYLYLYSYTLKTVFFGFVVGCKILQDRRYRGIGTCRSISQPSWWRICMSWMTCWRLWGLGGSRVPGWSPTLGEEFSKKNCPFSQRLEKYDLLGMLNPEVWGDRCHYFWLSFNFQL